MKAHVTSDLCQISQFNYYFSDHSKVSAANGAASLGINIYCALACFQFESNRKTEDEEERLKKIEERKGD